MSAAPPDPIPSIPSHPIRSLHTRSFYRASDFSSSAAPRSSGKPSFPVAASRLPFCCPHPATTLPLASPRLDHYSTRTDSIRFTSTGSCLPHAICPGLTPEDRPTRPKRATRDDAAACRHRRDASPSPRRGCPPPFRPPDAAPSAALPLLSCSTTAMLTPAIAR